MEEFSLAGKELGSRMTREHPTYRIVGGKEVPSVTQVLSILDKGEGLLNWIWNCGRKSIGWKGVRDKAGQEGTIIHYLIKCNLDYTTPALSLNEVEIVRNKILPAFMAWLKWDREHPERVLIASEVSLVSDIWGYGGTLDYIYRDNSGVHLVDFKTGGKVYPSMGYQLAAYHQLWEEARPDCLIDDAYILRLDKGSGEYSFVPFPDLGKDFEIFRHCLSLYQLRA